MPKVSVIVPNYNHAPYLKQRIDSVLNQSYQDYELILMDDCSKDDSVSILNHYKTHPKVTKVLINDRNSGSTFKQWNKGIADAKGEYIWLAESDDYAAPNFLEKMVAHMQSRETLGLVFCESNLVNEFGESLGKGSDLLSENARKEWDESFVLQTLDDRMKEFTQFNIIVNASAVLFKKTAYLAAGGAEEKMKLAGDWLLWLKLAINNDIMFLNEKLNYFRCHTNNVRSTTKKLLFLESGEIMQKISSIEGISPSNRQEAKRRQLDFWVLSMYNLERKYFVRNVALTLHTVKLNVTLVLRTLKDVLIKSLKSKWAK